MSYRLEFGLAGLSKMTNPSGAKSTHWRYAQKEKHRWYALVEEAVSLHRRPAKPLERARLTLTRYSSVSPDPDGLVSGFKNVIDGLVRSRVLVNDRWENIGMPDYRWEKAKPKHGGLHVIVEERT